MDQIVAAAENDPNPFPRITVELVAVYLVLPALALIAAARVLKALLRLFRKRRKVKAFKPTSRYYR